MRCSRHWGLNDRAAHGAGKIMGERMDDADFFADSTTAARASGIFKIGQPFHGAIEPIG